MTFDPRPDGRSFDESAAVALVGTHVLVGLTSVDRTGTAIELKQIHGEVARASRAEGIVLLLSSGEEFALPPALDALQPAVPGEYRLRGSGEIVVDPDFTATFTITMPTQH